MHPFTPLPLILCAEFCNTHRSVDGSVEAQIQEIYRVLKEMSSVNNLARNFLSSIKSTRQNSYENFYI